MARSLLRSSLALSALLLHACTDDIAGYPNPDGGADAAIVGGLDAAVASVPVVLPPGCAPLGDPLPKTLSCTGLYGTAGTGPVEKAVHPANREFAPGTALWTDGADKLRWIALPEGKQIDTSNPNGWVFPDGTRVWKEFAFKGKRAETRYMYKHEGIWIFATYQWNETDTDAVAIESGADLPLPGGGIHTIPTRMQCSECHLGSRDKLLGFQQVLLGLPGAKGLDLPTLVAENRLSMPPARTSYVIPDDGTGRSAQTLSWIHVNCGVSCHNESSNAMANRSKMYLRIDPATLDAPSPADWNIIKMTVGVPSATANFPGVRIVPGSPDQSLIVQLAQTRGSNTAMPPIGTRIVDPEGIALLREWITRLGSRYPAPDAGVEMDGGAATDAATPDASEPAVDAASADAGSPVPEVADAAVTDAEVADAEVADAEVADAEVADAEVADAEVANAEATDAEVADAEVPDAAAAEAELPDGEVPPVVVDPGAV